MNEDKMFVYLIVTIDETVVKLVRFHRADLAAAKDAFRDEMRRNIIGAGNYDAEDFECIEHGIVSWSPGCTVQFFWNDE